MKFSIISPSFNQGAYLRACLESVESQASQGVHIEHIVLDNCSTDSTSEILASWAKRGSTDLIQRRLIIEKDRGQSHAINNGFDAATGDVVAWLNTDEYYHASALQLVEKFFHDHPEVDVVFGDCDFVDADGRLIGRRREFLVSESMLLEYGCYIPSCSTFMRRKVLDHGIRLDESYRVAMDFELYARLMRRGFRFGRIPTSLAAFTWHDTNISSTLVDRRLQERRRIQDEYMPARQPAWLRTAGLALARAKWQCVRVLLRAAARTKGPFDRTA